MLTNAHTDTYSHLKIRQHAQKTAAIYSEYVDNVNTTKRITTYLTQAIAKPRGRRTAQLWANLGTDARPSIACCLFEGNQVHCSISPFIYMTMIIGIIRSYESSADPSDFLLIDTSKITDVQDKGLIQPLLDNASQRGNLYSDPQDIVSVVSPWEKGYVVYPPCQIDALVEVYCI